MWERGGLQLLLPLPQPHSPRGGSSAGLLPSGCMNISSAGALGWPRTSVLILPVWDGLPLLPGWEGLRASWLGNHDWACGRSRGEARGGAGRPTSQSEAHSLNEVKLALNLITLIWFLTSPGLTSILDRCPGILCPSWAYLLPSPSSACFCFFKFLILERGEGRKEERERNVDVREKH